MNDLYSFAYVRPPIPNDPPPRWLAALRVYPDAPWVAAERHIHGSSTTGRPQQSAQHDDDERLRQHAA